MRAPAEQEGVGDEPQRRQIDVARAGRGELDEAPIERPIFLSGASATVLPSIAMSRPPPDSVIRPCVGFDEDIPALRPGLAEIELGA